MKRTTGGFIRSIIGRRFVLALTLLNLLSLPLTLSSEASSAHDGSDVTASDANDMSDSMTGGGIAPTLRIAAVEMDRFFSKQLTPSGESFSGYLVDLVEELSRVVPFQVEWVVVDKEEATGGKRKNGNSWAELTGKISNGTVNLSVVAIDSANVVQARRLSYTQPFLKSTLSLVVGASHTQPNNGPWLLENLVNSSDHSRSGFGVSSEGLAFQLKTSNSSLFQEIWNDRSSWDVVIQVEEGLRKVRQEESYVLLMESTEAAYHASRQPCDLLAHDQRTHETRYVFAGRRNASIVPLIDDAFDALLRGQFLSDLYRRWWVTDECTTLRQRGESAERDDRDHDLERIFFTSPIKFFKSRVAPQSHTPESTRSGSMVTTRLTKPRDDYDSYRGQYVYATVSNRPDTVDEFHHSGLNTISGHVSRSTDWDRKRDRTTPGFPSFEARLQTDPEFNRKSHRRSRTSRQQTVTTVPLQPLHAHSTRTTSTGRELNAPRGVSSGQGRWPQGSVNDGHHQRAGKTPGVTLSATAQWTSTRSSRELERDFDWVFVTQQPRSSDVEFDYAIDSYDDDHDDDFYHEPMITVRMVTEPRQKNPTRVTMRVDETKQKNSSTRVSFSKETGAKSDAKPIRKTLQNSSSSSSNNIQFSNVLTPFLVSLISRLCRL